MTLRGRLIAGVTRFSRTCIESLSVGIENLPAGGYLAPPSGGMLRPRRARQVVRGARQALRPWMEEDGWSQPLSIQRID